MGYTGYELIWLFFIYSFLGWVLETVNAAVKQKRFINRGLVNSPFCVIYGITASVIALAGQELPGFWLFVGSAVLATVIEWTAGHILERLYHEKWWDYSDIKWNLDGYVCLPYSLVWGALSVFALRWGNSFLLLPYHCLPGNLGRWLLLLLMGILALDITATMVILGGRSRRTEQWEAVDSWFQGLSLRLGKWMYTGVNQRIERAYPRAVSRTKEETAEKTKAESCSFTEAMLLFVTGAFLGDITETIFCRITAGIWMSRSSLVWGPFSIVWGLAIAAVTVLLYRYKDRSDRFLFLTGTVLGGVYEYLCSVFTEVVFGTVFWDYSGIPFNLGGRINLLYCFFWGIATVVWFKAVYPAISRQMGRFSVRSRKYAAGLLAVFMICNMSVSAMALIRSDERSRGVEASSRWQEIMDQRFDDQRLERIYPNAIKVEQTAGSEEM